MADKINTKTITLIASDGQRIKVPEMAAKQSKTIYSMMAVDNFSMTNFPLNNIDSETLTKVMEYCIKHAAEEPSKLGQGSSTTRSNSRKASEDDGLREWDKEYMNVDVDTLYRIMCAALYLDIAGLLDLVVLTVTDMIRGKKVYEIRKIFNIESDFSPEDEAAIRRENPWAFE